MFDKLPEYTPNELLTIFNVELQYFKDKHNVDIVSHRLGHIRTADVLKGNTLYALRVNTLLMYIKVFVNDNIDLKNVQKLTNLVYYKKFDTQHEFRKEFTQVLNDYFKPEYV